MKQYNNKIAFFFATLGWWVLNIISYVLRAIPFAISIVCHGIALLMVAIGSFIKDFVLSIQPTKADGVQKTSVPQ